MQITPADCARSVFHGGLTIVKAVIWTGRTVIWLIGSVIKCIINTIKAIWNLIANSPSPTKHKATSNADLKTATSVSSADLKTKTSIPSAHSHKPQSKTQANVESDLKTLLAKTHYPERDYAIDWSSNDIYMFGVHDQYKHFPQNIIEKLKSKGLSETYDFLSNFYLFPISVDGEDFKSVEHYFQANKFKGQPVYEQIKNAKDPNSTKVIVRQNGNPRYPGTRGIEIMKKGLWAKFIQPNGIPTLLGEKLLQTKGHLIEGNKRIRESDKIWGAEFDNNWSKLHGRNQLGQMLMEIREQLWDYQL